MRDELLFIQGIGVSGVSILEAWSLQVANRREVAGAHRGVEIVDVVLMIRRVALPADHGQRSGARVGWIRCGFVILERLMMRNIVGLFRVGDQRRGAARASR